MRVHEFLLDADEPEAPLEIAADLREAVDGLPETAATWRPCDHTNTRHRSYEPIMVEMLGAWRVPDRFPTNGGEKWVNPHYAHAASYSDLTTTCACGEVTYGYGRGAQMDEPAIRAHADTCSEGSQKRARIDLYLRRVRWLKRAGLLWIRQPVARARLGFEHDNSATRLITPLGETYMNWYGWGKTAAANTMTILRGWGVDTQLIADAFGCSRQCVYSYRDECEPDVVTDRAPEAFRDHRTTT